MPACEKAVCGVAVFWVLKVTTPGPEIFCHDQVEATSALAVRVKLLERLGFCPAAKVIFGAVRVVALSMSETLSKFATELPLLLKEEIIRPATIVEGAELIVSAGPSWNQFVPSVDRKLVKTFPDRVSLTQ